MNILKRKIEREPSEKKTFSLASHGITSYHAAPAALMVVAGLAISSIVSDVPPSFNQVFASEVKEQTVSAEYSAQDFNGAVNGLLSGSKELMNSLDNIVFAEDLPETDYKPVLAGDILKHNASEERAYDFSKYSTNLSDAEIDAKLEEIEAEERQRELWEAQFGPVASSNRNLYLDTYRYQRGPSNIPSTGLDLRLNTDGIPISQMQMPESLTFDENGVPENYLYMIEGKSTAYYGGYMTATGSATRQGVVAVDPRQIPYGTEMWIVSSDGKYVYGFARAEDTGGFIYFRNGATVDLYMNTYSDCCVWGWRGVKIYILPTSYK